MPGSADLPSTVARDGPSVSLGTVSGQSNRERKSNCQVYGFSATRLRSSGVVLEKVTQT